MNEEALKDELLKKDKEQIIELYLQKCYDTNVEIEQLKVENKELKDEIYKWQTQYASSYVNRQNALIAEKVELQQQLKDNTKQVCNDVLEDLLQRFGNSTATTFDRCDIKSIISATKKKFLDQTAKGSAE